MADFLQRDKKNLGFRAEVGYFDRIQRMEGKGVEDIKRFGIVDDIDNLEDFEKCGAVKKDVSF
jgi:hypothetical protein